MSNCRKLSRIARIGPLGSIWALVALVLGAGCGTVLESWQEVDLLDSGDPSVDLAGAHDCETTEGYELDSYVARDLSAPELHIIGVWEPRAPFAGPDGEIVVRIHRPGNLALVLSSFASARWNLEVGPRTALDHVIINGYEPQQVDILEAGAPPATPEAPPTSITSVSATVDGDYLGLGYSWPTESELSGVCTDFYPSEVCEVLGDSWEAGLQRQVDELSRLVRSSEALTDRSLSSFHGCYHLSHFELLE